MRRQMNWDHPPDNWTMSSLTAVTRGQVQSIRAPKGLTKALCAPDRMHHGCNRVPPCSVSFSRREEEDFLRR